MAVRNLAHIPMIDVCSVCHAPAHASETDDLDRCEKCRNRLGTHVVLTTPLIAAPLPTTYKPRQPWDPRPPFRPSRRKR